MVFRLLLIINAINSQISQCLIGNVSHDFNSRAAKLIKIDNDNDDFLSLFDSNDNNTELNNAYRDFPMHKKRIEININY